MFVPKILVTEGLIDTLKMLRTQNNVKSKDLAKHINKTPGYISKLEKFEIKSIELDVVESILGYILGDNYKKTETWEQIHASLQIKYTKTEIENEIWFANFDTVYRLIPIPRTLIEFFNEKIDSLKITRDYLLKRINANEALSDEEIKDVTIKENVWYISKQDNRSFIKINFDEEKLSKILDYEETDSAYVFVFCILYYLLKIEQYGEIVKIEEEQIRDLNKKTTSILNEHKFYSIIERESLVRSAQSKEEVQNLLSSFDNENNKLISEILTELKFASEYNINITNKRLSGFLQNLSNDVWFTLKIVSLDYHLLDSLDFDKRKEFISEIELLIQKYADSQESLKKAETY